MAEFNYTRGFGDAAATDLRQTREDQNVMSAMAVAAAATVEGESALNVINDMVKDDWPVDFQPIKSRFEFISLYTERTISKWSSTYEMVKVNNFSLLGRKDIMDKIETFDGSRIVNVNELDGDFVVKWTVW
jgi:hypothetical protein